MKTSHINKNTSVSSLLIFLASFGISFSLVNEFVFDKPKSELLVIMICLLVAGFASKKRNQSKR